MHDFDAIFDLRRFCVASVSNIHIAFKNAFASPAMRHLGTCRVDFQQFFSLLQSHKKSITADSSGRLVSIFSIALTMCEVGNKWRSITLRKL